MGYLDINMEYIEGILNHCWIIHGDITSAHQTWPAMARFGNPEILLLTNLTNTMAYLGHKF